MIDQIEIISASIISFSLLVLVFGIVWSPFAALICARAGSNVGTSGGDLARTGMVHSVLFFIPWVYFLLRIRNRRISDRVVVGTYVVLYLACLLGPILFNLLLAAAILNVQSNYPIGDGYADHPFNRVSSFWTGTVFGWPQIFSSGAFFTFESAVFWVGSLSAASTGFLYLWARSLNGLYRTHLTVRGRGHRIQLEGDGLPDPRYMEPFRTAFAILGLWLLCILALVTIGIVVFDDCTLNCTT